MVCGWEGFVVVVVRDNKGREEPGLIHFYEHVMVCVVVIDIEGS